MGIGANIQAEPWLFEATGKHAKGGSADSGTTGLSGMTFTGVC